MNEFTIYLDNTNIEHFWVWLEGYTSGPRKIIPDRIGHYCVDRVRGGTTGLGRQVFSIGAKKITEKNGRSFGSLYYDEVGRFDPIQVGGRLKVKISYIDAKNFFLFYFYPLLIEIGKDWPSAEPLIYSHVQEVANHFGVDLSDEESGKEIKSSEPEYEPRQGKKSKSGPRNYSREQKITAIKKWDALDRDKNPIRLEDWLEKEFGAEAGVLKVAVSTFHGWRKLI